MGTLNEVVDSIMRDVGHEVSRAQIEQVASEVAAQFEDARITAYIPIIMDRMIRVRFQEQMRRPAA